MDSYALRKLAWKELNQEGRREELLSAALHTETLDDPVLRKEALNILKLGTTTLQDAMYVACDETDEEGYRRIADLMNAWPFGMYTDEIHERYLAIGLRDGNFTELMNDLMRQAAAMGQTYPGYEKDKSILVLMSTFDAGAYAGYEDMLIQECINNNILVSFFLVTDYDVIQIPTFAPNRQTLRQLHESFGTVRFMDRDKASGELEWYPVDYKKGSKTWVFDFYHMTWEVFTDDPETAAGEGSIPENAADDFCEIAMNYYDYEEATEDPAAADLSSDKTARIYDRDYDLNQKSLAPLSAAFEELIASLA